MNLIMHVTAVKWIGTVYSIAETRARVPAGRNGLIKRLRCLLRNQDLHLETFLEVTPERDIEGPSVPFGMKLEMIA